MIFADQSHALAASRRLYHVTAASVLRDMRREEVSGTELSESEEWVSYGVTDWRMSFE